MYVGRLKWHCLQHKGETRGHIKESVETMGYMNAIAEVTPGRRAKINTI